MCAHNNDTYTLLHGENFVSKVTMYGSNRRTAANQKFLLCSTCKKYNKYNKNFYNFS